MNEKLEIAKKIACKLLENASCEFAEIRLASSKGTSISLSKDQIDNLTQGDSISGSIRILKDGGWGFISFNNLNQIEKYFKKALLIASELKSSKKIKIKRQNAIIKNFKTKSKIPTESIPIDKKINLIQEYNDILKNHNTIQTTRATYKDVQTDYLYLNNEGSIIYYDKSYCGISLASIAKDGALIQPFHDSISGYGGFELVENQHTRAEETVKIAVDLLSAEPIKGGRHNVILDPKLSGVFIHEAFGHLSEADFVYENNNLKKQMQLGTVFANNEFNVVDEGNREELSGYTPFDDEGVMANKTYLIKNGILSGRLHSRETAEKMDEEVTGNGRSLGVSNQPIVRMTNTYIENGKYSKNEILDSAEEGIYAVDVIGGQTNLEMFTFTSGYGYKIKNGKKGKMYRDIVISGNVFETLKNVDKIGNDLQMFGGLGGCGKGGQSPLPVSFGGPHLSIKNVLIGGKQ